jgi:hypothetical protein
MICTCFILLSLLRAAQPADDPAEDPTSQPSGEIRRGLRMDDPPEARQERYFERLARQIEPELKGSPEKLDVYVRFFAHEVIHDQRIIAFDVSATL